MATGATNMGGEDTDGAAKVVQIRWTLLVGVEKLVQEPREKGGPKEALNPKLMNVGVQTLPVRVMEPKVGGMAKCEPMDAGMPRPIPPSQPLRGGGNWQT